MDQCQHKTKQKVAATLTEEEKEGDMLSQLF